MKNTLFTSTVSRSLSKKGTPRQPADSIGRKLRGIRREKINAVAKFRHFSHSPCNNALDAVFM
jgi:hypothetical protein